MPSEMKITPTSWGGESCDLDSRYGELRISLKRDAAEEMVRLDNLIEAAGIVLGDRIEVLMMSWSEDPKTAKIRPARVEKWLKLGDATFRGVNNGRFMVTDYDGGTCAFSELPNILDVRKEQNESPD